MNFSGFSFLCFGGILGFFSLWVGDGGKGREMREGREDFLSARCNESGNRILYLRVGGYL